MALNLKNDETERLARKLAQATGESITLAVTVAIKERLERQERARRRERLSSWLDKFTKETSAMMNDGRTSKELMDDLYDPETGLPR